MAHNVSVSFINCDKNDEYRAFTESDMESDFMVFHSEHFVYIAVHMISLLHQLYNKAQETLNLTVKINSNIRQKIITMKKCQKMSWPNYLANFWVNISSKTTT